MQTADLFELSNELIQQRQPHAWITVVGVKSPSSAYVGAQAIVTSDGQLHGWIGGGCVQSTARAAALGSLTSMAPQRLRLSNSSDSSEDPDVRPMNCPSNGEIELFIQPVAVRPRLRIYGNTPVARAAAWLAREADFEPTTDAEAADAEMLAAATATASAAATGPAAQAPASTMGPAVQAPADTMGPAQDTPPIVTDSAANIRNTSAVRPLTTSNAGTLTRSAQAADTARGDRTRSTPVAPTPGSSPDGYALIATQGDGDESALESALRSPALAVLVVASKRKAERLRAAMTLRGIPESRLAAMRAPAGPNIGAVTPNEIALAAIAGLIALRRGQPTEGGKRHESRPALAPNASNATGYVNPVCGAVVDPTRALSSLTMEGQTHYFCCEGCRVEFERDPGKYLAIAAHMRTPATL
jgi:xanthine/CO dehydrogenase XdhC/CoxF family maturation factor/YHS domain-containing protein